MAKATVELASDPSAFNQGLEKAKSSFSAFKNHVRKESEKLSGAGKGMGGHRMGNVAMQAQDVAVQLQSGAKAATIIAQQGSQILSAFGPSGAIAGGVLAIGAAIYSWATGTKEAEAAAAQYAKELDKIKQDTDSLRSGRFANERASTVLEAPQGQREFVSENLRYEKEVGEIHERMSADKLSKEKALAAAKKRHELEIAEISKKKADELSAKWKKETEERWATHDRKASKENEQAKKAIEDAQKKREEDDKSANAAIDRARAAEDEARAIEDSTNEAKKQLELQKEKKKKEADEVAKEKNDAKKERESATLSAFDKAVEARMSGKTNAQIRAEDRRESRARAKVERDLIRENAMKTDPERWKRMTGVERERAIARARGIIQAKRQTPEEIHLQKISGILDQMQKMLKLF